MMGVQNRQCSEEEKAKIALEAIKENKSIGEIALEYGVHPNQVVQWKKILIANAPNSFRIGKGNKEKSIEDELYKTIGTQAVQIEFLKKKFMNM